MAEQPDTPKILDELSRSNTAKPKRSGSNTFASALLVLVLIGLLSGAAYLAYEQLNQQTELQQLSEQNLSLRQQLQAQTNELTSMQARLEQASSPVEIDDSRFQEALNSLQSSTNAELNRLRQQLNSAQTQLARVSEQPGTDWKLGEAQYLLGIANQKLQLEGDINGAIALLQQSDAALRAANSANVIALREAVAANLQTLRSLQAVDRDGLYLRINALQEQVASLDLLGSMRDNFEARRNRSSEPVEVSATEYGIVNASLQFLSSVFVWRRWEESPEAMLMPGQDAYIKQNMALMLEQAKLALLMRDANLYQRALTDARETLQRYAGNDSSAETSVNNEITELMGVDIDPALPDLSATLDLVASLLSAQQ